MKHRRTLQFEPLENRLALSAAGVTDDPQVYSGGLEDKIVYIHGGHGYTTNNGGWGFQRPELFEMVEDLGNQDQMSLLADYLLRAGATVVPLRPVGHQEIDFVLDNDDVGVTFTGAWSNSSAGIYFGDAGDVPYRFASTNSTETATARYQPNFTESGFYPVYSWTRYGSDRAADQLYRIHHAGGETEVTINHRRVGNGLVYLGTYYFDSNEPGYVEISNRSSEAGRVVIADMIRFGNGMGDINNGAGLSGRPREDEAGLYWVEWHAERSQGVPSSEYRVSSSDLTATVSLSPRYAEYMNREADGSLSDRVFVSFHSNAGGGSSRGVLGLYNGNNNPATATPNQFLLAQTLANEVNDDLVAQNGSFEHNWFDRGSSLTLDRSDIEFGEINNLRINNEFDATIIETGFHDNQTDAEMLRDPRVRDAIAKATYQGIVKYFRAVDGNTTPATVAPAQVDGLWTSVGGEGSVTIGWDAPPVTVALGGTPTGYRVYASTNGYGFDGGTLVAGAGTTSHTFVGLDPTKTYYFKVVAVNEGGESQGSQVVAARPVESARNVLIINGFDRQSRSLNPTSPFGGGGNTVDRVRPYESNGGDYVVPVADSLARVQPNITVASASNESVISGDVSLGDYDVVIWMSGEESTDDDTFNATEQALVSAYVAAGGALFASGSEIGWDLDAQNGGQAFFNDTFLADYASDDANTYAASGAAGGIFEGVSLNFDDGAKFYDVNFPDVLTPLAGASTVLTYSGGGGAGILAPGVGGRGDVLLFGFPIESILDTSDLDAILLATLETFELDIEPAYTFDGVVDNFDDEPAFKRSSGWNLAVSASSFAGNYYIEQSPLSATATWQFDLDGYGQAELFGWWVAASNRADSVVYSVETAFGTHEFSADQTQNGGQWVSLGSFPVAAGVTEVTLDTSLATGGTVVVADAVRLVVANGTPAIADFNNDLVVDIADFTLWRDQLGTSVTPGEGADASGDGQVTVTDYQFWREQFGNVLPPPAATSVESQELSGQTPSLQSLQLLPSASVGSLTASSTSVDTKPVETLLASPPIEVTEAVDPTEVELLSRPLRNTDAYGTPHRKAPANRLPYDYPQSRLLLFEALGAPTEHTKPTGIDDEFAFAVVLDGSPEKEMSSQDYLAALEVAIKEFDD